MWEIQYAWSVKQEKFYCEHETFLDTFLYIDFFFYELI